MPFPFTKLSLTIMILSAFVPSKIGDINGKRSGIVAKFKSLGTAGISELFPRRFVRVRKRLLKVKIYHHTHS